MSRKIKYYFTDVFGNEKYSGNQLATFVNCDFLSDKEMQQIAREINFSETTFILDDKMVNGGYNVRIFTPGAEIDFAGHPTLGTAYIIHNYIGNKLSDTVILNLKVGQIKVTVQNGILWMKQLEPQFGKIVEKNAIAALLNIQTEDINEKYPVQEVSTGLPFTIVPLRNMKALKRCKVNTAIYEKFCKKTEAKAILVFSPEGYEKDQHLSVRVFVDYLGIPEDPATGSGNGCLAGYLAEHTYFGSKEIDIITGQGYEIGRPSQIYLRTGGAEGFNIRVGGNVIKVAEGEWD